MFAKGYQMLDNCRGGEGIKSLGVTIENCINYLQMSVKTNTQCLVYFLKIVFCYQKVVPNTE